MRRTRRDRLEANRVPPPLLIPLPLGLHVSGVVTWAVRAVNALAARGRTCGLVIHPAPARQRPIEPALDPRVRVYRTPGPPRAPLLASCEGDLSAFIPVYRRAVEELGAGSREPVVLCPTLLGDCFGICAALTLATPERVRVVGFAHADIAYDAAMIAHYAPALTHAACVADAVEARVRAALAGAGPHAPAVVNIPNGVPIPGEPLRRGPLAGRPLRLIYTGRFEHAQKRILALPLLSVELARRGVAHELTIVGDGPGAADLADALAARREPAETYARIHTLEPMSPDELTPLLDAADAFVLPSRYEGLSVALLEAMARGCVPIVTRVTSGNAQVLAHGVSGLVADAGPEADENAAAAALANSIARLLAGDVESLRAGARAAASRFSLEAHADRFERLIDGAAAAPARAWPASRACACTGDSADASGGSGTVPAGALAKARVSLEKLAGRDIVIHGAGRHTVALAAALADSPARIVAIADDDRGRWGTALLGWPVIAPSDARAAGATDVLISSWLHEQSIYDRREVYTDQGLSVHRLYN